MRKSWGWHRTCLAYLGACGGYVGPVLGHLGASWGHVEACWACIGWFGACGDLIQHLHTMRHFMVLADPAGTATRTLASRTFRTFCHVLPLSYGVCLMQLPGRATSSPTKYPLITLNVLWQRCWSSVYARFQAGNNLTQLCKFNSIIR